MFRMALERDRPGVIQLWQQVFGDEEPFISQCVRQFIGWDNLYVAVQPLTENTADEVVGILSAVPSNIGIYKGVYLFALATEPEVRGGGIMSGLMGYAEKMEKDKGAKFAALIPAEKSLFDYYSKRGYTEKINYRTLTRDVLIKNNKITTDNRPVGGVDFKCLRATYVNCEYLDFSEQGWDLVLETLRLSGASFIRTKNGYGVYYLKNNKVGVAELFASSKDDAEEVLQAIAQKTGKTHFTITLREASTLLDGNGELKPGALLKKLEEDFTISRVYLRFGIDEVFEKDFESF